MVIRSINQLISSFVALQRDGDREEKRREEKRREEKRREEKRREEKRREEKRENERFSKRSIWSDERERISEKAPKEGSRWKK